MRNGRRASTVRLVRQQLRRVEIRFDCTAGEMRLEYATTAAEAGHFAEAMITRGYRVLVDRNAPRAAAVAVPRPVAVCLTDSDRSGLEFNLDSNIMTVTAGRSRPPMR